VFMAVGIGIACVVVGLLIPSARLILDRRRDLGRGAGDVPLSGRPGPLPRVMAAAAGVAGRRPVPVLVVVAVLTFLGVLAGIRLDTTLNQEQFIPEDAEAGEVIDRMEDLFGGQVQERSFVVVDADLDDPDVANAILRAGENMAAVDDVVMAQGVAAVTSPPHLVQRVAQSAELGIGDDDVAEAFRAAGWEDGRFASDADMATIWQLVEPQAPAQLGRHLRPDRNAALISVETRAGPDRVGALIDDLGDAAAPIDEVGQVSVTSLQLVLAETLDALVAAQVQKIFFAAGAAIVVLVLYFGLAHRRPGLGALTMVPTLVALPLVLGGMWLLDLSFNALTATITAVAIGFGVDYGIHVSNRFIEERERHDDPEAALRETVTHTGTALVTSAATTAGAFIVLYLFSDIEPLRQFGAVTALILVFALAATLFAEASCLTLWDRWTRRRERDQAHQGDRGREPVTAQR
jgi:uncharacterized protein